MRADGKPEGLRQSMSWLHTWSGLVLGWLLYAVFFTGTASYFQNEITSWMRPELHKSSPAAPNVDKAIATLQKMAPNAQSWTLNLPGQRETAITASWREATQPGQGGGNQGQGPQAQAPTPPERTNGDTGLVTVQAGRGGKTAYLDAATGELLPVRETRGGNFLYRFHFELHAIPRIWGRWIVGIATALMFVAIISGVITHKKIFSDFFTFRPRKGQRSWLDAHNATAVLALPFHIVITFSGLLLLMGHLMPWAIDGAYQGDRQAYLAERRGGAVQRAAQPQGQQGAGTREARPPAGNGGESRTARQNRGAGNATADARPDTRADTRPESRSDTRPDAAQPEGSRSAGRPRGERRANPEATAALASLAPMLAEAQRIWGGVPASTITITAPNTARAKVDLRERDAQTFTNRGARRQLIFDGTSGKLLQQPEVTPPTATAATYNVLTAAHMGRGVDASLRWLLFLFGVIGTFMAGTGMVLWVVKREPDRRKLGRTPWGHRLVMVLNTGAIAGLSVATAGYFWANRLIPAEMPARTDWEIRSFFAVWLLCLLYPVWREGRHAWRELAGLAALLFGLLPILNGLSGGAALPQSIAHGQWSVAGFDLAMLALAAIHGAVAWHLRPSAKPATKTAAKPTPKAPKAAPTPATATAAAAAAAATPSIAAASTALGIDANAVAGMGAEAVTS